MKHFALSLFFLILCPISILVVRAEEKDNAEEVRYILTSQEKLYEGIPENRGDSWLIKLPGQTGGLMVYCLSQCSSGVAAVRDSAIRRYSSVG